MCCKRMIKRAMINNNYFIKNTWKKIIKRIKNLKLLSNRKGNQLNKRARN